MPREHEVVDLAQRVMQELAQDPPKMAKALFGGSQPDAQDVGKTEYIAAVRRAYETGDVATRQKMAKTNPAAFNVAVKALGVVVPGEPGHSQPIAPLQAGQPMEPPPVNQVPPAQPPMPVAPPTPPVLPPSGAILPGQPQGPQLATVPQSPPPMPMPGPLAA